MTRRAADLMTPDFYCVTPGTRIGDVADAMDEYGVSCLPVVSRERLVGIVTARDLALRGLRARSGRGTPVRQIMTRSVVCCRLDDPLAVVCQIMAAHGVRRMPVLDASDRPRGFLTLRDLAPELDARSLGALVRGIGEESAYVAASSDSRWTPTATAGFPDMANPADSPSSVAEHN